MEITKIQHNFGAQRSASMQAEYKDIRTGNKGTDRFRVSEDVESTLIRTMAGLNINAFTENPQFSNTALMTSL